MLVATHDRDHDDDHGHGHDHGDDHGHGQDNGHDHDHGHERRLNLNQRRTPLSRNPISPQAWHATKLRGHLQALEKEQVAADVYDFQLTTVRQWTKATPTACAAPLFSQCLSPYFSYAGRRAGHCDSSGRRGAQAQH